MVPDHYRLEAASILGTMRANPLRVAWAVQGDPKREHAGSLSCSEIGWENRVATWA